MATPFVIYAGKPKPHAWARWMRGRTIKKNNNVLCSFVGPTGSGKTWSAVSVGEIVSKLNDVPFTIDNIVFGLKELLDLINSNTLKRGSVIVFDEPQASISSKDFQSTANKIFNLLVSTFRHRNYCLFFCCPHESMLDKSTRRLFHARFETLSINQKTKTCRLKPRFIEYSDFKSQPYIKQLIVSFKDDFGVRHSRKLFHWDVPKPSEDLIEAYEKKKLEFTTRLNANISKKLQEFDSSGKSMTADNPEIDKRKPLTGRQEEVLRLIAGLKGNRFEQASKILKVSSAAISETVSLAKKKGYTIEEFEEDGHE